MKKPVITSKKLALRRALVEIAIEALTKKGWTVHRVKKAGSSVRLIRRGKKEERIAIRSSQDRRLAFPRDKTNQGWATLADLDSVVVAAVDDIDKPLNALIHKFDGDDIRARFDRAFKARKQDGYSIPAGSGVWLPLYEREEEGDAYLAGAGVGLVHPPFARVPLPKSYLADDSTQMSTALGESDRLTIPEAKRRLAWSLGIDEANIEIIIKG